MWDGIKRLSSLSLNGGSRRERLPLGALQAYQSYMFPYGVLNKEKHYLIFLSSWVNMADVDVKWRLGLR